MSKFTDAINHYCDDMHVAVGAAACCDECRQAYDIDSDLTDDEAQEILYDAAEASFSWSQCDSCGSTLGGDRHEAHGLIDGDDGCGLIILHMSICSDCMIYHANGEEPETWES